MPTLDDVKGVKSQSPSFHEAEWVSGASMVLRGDYIRKFGGFDENIFLYGEDADICRTTRINGFRVGSLKTIPLIHANGWIHSRRNPTVSMHKYNSLNYRIHKNHYRRIYRWLLLMVLPIYVFGWRRGLKFSVRRVVGRHK